MKIVLFSLLLVGSFTSLYAQSWEKMASSPVGRHHGIAFGLEGAGYLVAGVGPDFISTKTVFKYDPLLDQWKELDPYPGVERNYGISDTWDKKAYLGFGTNNGEFLNDLWSFEPTTNTWLQLAECECTPRAHPAFVAHKEKIYMGLGGGAQGDLKDWWVYDIATNMWTQKADFPATERHHPFQFAIGDYVYVGFGHHSVDIYDDLYRYDPITDTWTQMADLPAEGRVAGTQFSYGGKGYILSGEGSDHMFMNTGEFWSYDPVTNTWAQLPPHPGRSLWAPASFVIDNYAYLTTGELLNNFTTNTWRYKLGNISSVDAPEQVAPIDVWPNPFRNLVTVTALEGSTNADNARLRVYNTMMQVVSEGTGSQAQLDLSSLPNGLYKLEWSNGGKIYYKSILKQ